MDRPTSQNEAGFPDSLMDAAAYPHRVASTELRQTHISWVFLVGDRVYKVKKPVVFPFLDYGSIGRRLEACREEVDVNSRLAPGVYLGVRPIVRRPDGALRIVVDGPAVGPVVDYCVEMKRLADEQMLDRRITDGAATEADVHRLMDRLIPFYAGARRGPEISKHATRDAVLANVLGNLESICEDAELTAAGAADRLRSSQLQYLTCQERLFEQRIRAGRIVDGHGDLKPEHVCLGEPLAVFDAIEFSPSLRAGDILGEISFLAMECEFLGAPKLSRAVLEEYRTRSRDDFPDHLACFYQAYRASVRAKVELIKAAQLVGEAAEATRNKARRYAQLASFQASGFHRPLLLVTVGAAGSGKSTIAAELAGRLGAKVLRTDVVRQTLAGRREPDAPIGVGIYDARSTERTYEELFAQARRLLAESVSVVLDGSFTDEKRRAQARRMAQAAGAQCVLLYCRVQQELAARRILVRREEGKDPSDARPEVHRIQAAELEQAGDLADADVLTLAGDDAPEQTVARVIELLSPLYAAPTEETTT